MHHYWFKKLSNMYEKAKKSGTSNRRRRLNHHYWFKKLSSNMYEKAKKFGTSNRRRRKNQQKTKNRIKKTFRIHSKTRF